LISYLPVFFEETPHELVGCIDAGIVIDGEYRSVKERVIICPHEKMEGLDFSHGVILFVDTSKNSPNYYLVFFGSLCEKSII
jgi:hypothetical protein